MKESVPVLYVNPLYISDTSTEAQNQVYQHYKKIVESLANGEINSICLPNIIDPETKEQHFKLIFVQR